MNERSFGKSSFSRQVWLLGGLQLQAHERPITLTGKLSSLFTYLILHPSQSHSREILADLFWQHAPPDRVRRNFSDALYRLRQLLGPDWISGDGDKVSLEPTADLWVDVWEFERQCAQGDWDALERAVALYRGDLAPEIYDDWVLPRRVRLRETYLATLLRLAQRAEQNDQSAHAFEYYHRLVYADALNEEAQRGLMRVYARLGRPAAALQQYEQLAHLLAQELDAAPLPETRALAETIRAEYHAALEPAVVVQPFVGRRRERALLLKLAEQAQAGEGGLVLVEGEAGIGKTRLLETFAEGAAWRGLTVVWGKARELEGVAPYSPLDQALQTAFAGPRADQAREQLAPAVIQVLSGLVPRLRRGPPLHFAALPDLPTALAAGLAALADLAPHVLIFDDVQWAEAGFWDVLQKCKGLNWRMLIVLGYRAADVRAHARAWEALCALDRDLMPPRVTLGGLSVDECAQLARASGQALEGTTALALHDRTCGIPLLVREVLEGRAGEAANLNHLFAQRFENLNPFARAALQAAAVLGREFTHGTWQSLVGVGVLEAIPALLAARFIQETEQGYSFQHDLAREFVYGLCEQTPARARELHGRAGEILRLEGAEPGALAWHFERAEGWSEAVRFYREAGDRAASIFAYDAALSHYQRASELLPGLNEPENDRIALLTRQQRVYRATVQEREWRATVDQLEKAALAADDRGALLEALQARISLNVLAADWDTMQIAAERAIALAQEDGNLAAEARTRADLGWHLADMLGKPHDALPQLQRAARLAQELNDTRLWLEVLGHLAFSQRIVGQSTAARETAERVLQIAGARDELRLGQASALEILGQVEIDLAHWQAARETMRQFVQLATELKERWLVGQGLFNQAFIATRMGQPAEAQRKIQELKSLLAQAGLGPPADHWMWTEALHADALVLAGELEPAGRVLDGMRAWIESRSEGRPLLLALTALGRLRLAQNRPAAARAALERACNVWERAGGTIEVAPLLLYALAAHRVGADAAARDSLRRVQDILRGTDVAAHTVLLHLARYELAGDAAALRAAYAEIQRQAALFTDEKLRTDFLDHYREILAQYQAQQPTITVTARLARAHVPLGKPLTENDFVVVRWTVDAGEQDAALFEREGKAALRRHRLARLIEQARAQGAAPTDADLARALGVNPRTVERDMAALKAAGKALATRRRK